MSYRMYVACMLYHDSVVTDRLSDGQFSETLQLLPYQGFERRNKCIDGFDVQQCVSMSVCICMCMYMIVCALYLYVCRLYELCTC